MCQPHTPPSPLKQKIPPLAQSADRRESFKRQRFRQKAPDQREVKIPDSYRDKMQALKRQHLTRETVRRHLQKQAGGAVLVSGWNDSYGNQVLLDNGAGLSTRYAHMTQTAVTAGEAVTAGQVIGYVGSTGDSTGNHLHFEVMQNGVRVNPMDMVSVR